MIPGNLLLNLIC